MSKIALERITFIELLHEVFIKKTGHGAFAYLSIAETLNLFDVFLASGETASRFIKQYVRSF